MNKSTTRSSAFTNWQSALKKPESSESSKRCLRVDGRLTTPPDDQPPAVSAVAEDVRLVATALLVGEGLAGEIRDVLVSVAGLMHGSDRGEQQAQGFALGRHGGSRFTMPRSPRGVCRDRQEAAVRNVDVRGFERSRRLRKLGNGGPAVSGAAGGDLESV